VVEKYKQQFRWKSEWTISLVLGAAKNYLKTPRSTRGFSCE